MRALARIEAWKNLHINQQMAVENIHCIHINNSIYSYCVTMTKHGFFAELQLPDLPSPLLESDRS